MGFFSWKTQDTGKSINNHYSGIPTFKVIMTDNKGNQWVEENYEGYGEFGGKDFYELLSEMNGGSGDRCDGIDRHFSNGKNQIYPSLTENGEHYPLGAPEDCEYQGYFYDEVCERIFEDIPNKTTLMEKLAERQSHEE